MKKSIKRLITVFAVCAVSAFAVVASGCNVTDKIKEKIEQARCEHEWNDGEVTKEATCMEKGELTKTCTLCDKVETEEIELAEHIAVYVQAVTPTCLEKGVTDGTVCSVCETKLSGFQEIPALGHIVVKDSAVKPTCLEDGLTEGKHCSRCSEVLTVQEVIPALGHKPSMIAGKAPTCTDIGYTEGVKCSNCNVIYVEREQIPALGHTLTTDWLGTPTVCGAGVKRTSCNKCSYFVDNYIDSQHIDENGDFVCEICNEMFPLKEGTYTEVDAVVGEKIVGNWYRIYRPAAFQVETIYGFYFTNLYNGSSALANNFIALDVSCYDEIVFSSGVWSIEGITYFCYDDYIDIYVMSGEYSVENGDNSMMIIDETVVIEEFFEGSIVKRLVANAE